MLVGQMPCALFTTRL